MKIIIVGVLCLLQASANGTEAVKKDTAAVQSDAEDGPQAQASNEPATHPGDTQAKQKPVQAPQISTEPIKPSVSKSLNAAKGSQGPDYMGVLVDTSPIRQQAQAARPPVDHYVPPPRRQQIPVEEALKPVPVEYAPEPRNPMIIPSFIPEQNIPGDMFKLEAYLTKDGRIVSGQLSSLHNTVHVTPHPNGVRLNRPGRLPVTAPHYPFTPLTRPPPGYAPPPPQYPQQGHMSQQELDDIVNNIVASSVGPDGQQVSPQLMRDIVNLLNGEMLTELAETLIDDSRRAGPTQTDAVAGDPNSQAFNYLGQLINQQLQERMGPILEQIPVPT